MKYIKLFENYQNDIENLISQLSDLDSLKDFALISADEYKQQAADLLKKIAAYNRDIIKKATAQFTPYSDEWYAEISKAPSLSWLSDLKELPEYSELIAAGFYPVASPVQLGNRTFVFAKDPNYKSGSDYALGLFSSINGVRRLTPDVERWGRKMPTLDQKLKVLDGSLTPIQFFKDGMRWAIDNLDLTQRGIPNKKTVRDSNRRDNEREVLTTQLKELIASKGIQIADEDYAIIPIDGLEPYSNMAELRKLATAIKRSAAKSGPLEIPIKPWTKYDQVLVDAMSRYPGVEWLVAPSQFVVDARTTRNWNIKPSSDSMQNVNISQPLAADDILRKLAAAGVERIQHLTIPMDQVNPEDYGIRVDRLKDTSHRY